MLQKYVFILLLFLVISTPSFCWWEDKTTLKNIRQYEASVFYKSTLSNKESRDIFQNEYFQDKKTTFGFGKDEDGPLNAPPPNIDEDSTPQKMLPLGEYRETLLYIFCLSFFYIIIRKKKRKYTLA
ncbi:MAG: hypothetical protein LUG18_15345 [Candidatus Azobacteroides sp.]|nr:hypothetical protein [Candidatus Azobacteroides sp.]